VTSPDIGVCPIGDNPDPAATKVAALAPQRFVAGGADMNTPVPEPLRRFIWDIQSMVELAVSEREVLVFGGDLMARLVAADGWLPDVFARPSEDHCRHYLIYGDGLERFSVASTVLCGNQAMLIRGDGVWDILGVLRGAVSVGRLLWEPGREPQPNGDAQLVEAGAVEVAPAVSGEAVELANAMSGDVSIVIHVYGGDIGRLARYPLEAGGTALGLASGYANAEDAPAYDIASIQADIRD
jgi:predicted metal-dependent enzyme (double-stranded beta helix superfamily)